MIAREVSMDRVLGRSRRAVNVDDSGLSFAGRLRHLRAERGWSQQQLADFAGLSCQAVKSCEWERTEPKAHTLEQLAATLGVSMQWLWTGQEAAS